MKRIWLYLILISLAGGSSVFAQEIRQNPGIPEKTVISGKLGVAGGMIALEEGGKTYYTAGLDRFTGFIDGLKEGAQVSLEGYAVPRYRGGAGYFFRVTKLTLNGKDYDLDTDITRNGSDNYPFSGRMMPGYGPRGPQNNRDYHHQERRRRPAW
jgi:hypothetical protein